MSYHVFFAFSTGLAKTITVPAGTKAAIMAHVEDVESTLGLKRTKYLDNPVHWDNFDEGFKSGFAGIDDKVLCNTVLEHNHWVRRCYEEIAHWSHYPFKKGQGHKAKHVIDRGYPIGHLSEKITPKDAEAFWHGFEELHVDTQRWTRDYYRNRMEHLYEVMRGRPDEGVGFDAKPLTEKQAAGVISLFSEYLDTHDLRLDVPNGRDFLASSYDGGYTWCEKCGAVGEGDEEACRKRACPLRAEREALDE